ncbi:MAG: hypothetical protein ABI680_08800, partial [Chthoniobacteraceae bacterium]
MNLFLRLFNAALALALVFPATLHAQTAGTLDPAFDPDVPPLADDIDPYNVRAAAVQPDGKIVIAGNFSRVGGEFRTSLARLHPDGTLESTTTFSDGNLVGSSISSGSGVFAVVLQPDGKILVAGSGGASGIRLARLETNGTVESTATFNPGSGPDSFVYGMALQPDGKILMGGNFTTVNGLTRNYFARLEANGTVEGTATFNPGSGANGAVHCVAVQADGKILLGGDFTSVNGMPRNRIARLNADGTVESTATFNPGPGADLAVHCMVVQPDGKILLGGDFFTVNGQSRNGIARLNPNGSLESTGTFNPGTGVSGGSFDVESMALQANGKILLAGHFSSVNGQARNGIARLNPNGSVESTSTFNPGTGPGGDRPYVTCVALQANGMILLGGTFTMISGQPRNKIARLANDGIAQDLTVLDSARVQWTRGGSAPEVAQVTFELSTDGGANWSALGAGTRIAGGWERTGLSLPAIGSLRARGRTSGGYGNGTAGIVEQVATYLIADSPEIAVEQPAGNDLANGASVTFPVLLGANASRTFTIRNPGSADLTGLGITIDGPDAAMFTVTASPVAPVSWPDGSTTPFGLNEERPNGSAVLYTPQLGASTRTSGGVELILEKAGETPLGPLRAGSVFQARVRTAREGGDAPIAADIMVLSISPQLVSRLPKLETGLNLKISTGTTP